MSKLHPPLPLDDLPPPTLWRVANCWLKGVREFDRYPDRSIVIVKSRHVVLLERSWWVRYLTGPIGQAMVGLCWVLFAVGMAAQAKPFGHILVTCKRQRCAISYEPPAGSPDVRVPPAHFKGRWKAWRADCECIWEERAP